MNLSELSKLTEDEAREQQRNTNMNIYIPPTLNKTISQKIFFWSLTVCCCLVAVLFLVAILWLTQAINDVGFN